jgi:acetyl esterase/lipase
MRKIFTIASLALSSLLCAQSPIYVKLAEEKVVNEKPLIKRWVNADEYTEATLIIYPAKTPNGQAIIACPGGGYSGIASTHEGHDMAAWFNTQGITYAVLHYRMPYGNHEIPLSDAHQAIRYLRKNAAQWGIHQLGIMGFSAGGHLAAHYSNAYDIPEVRSVFPHSKGVKASILCYSVINALPENAHKGSFQNLTGCQYPLEDALTEKFSCDRLVTDRTPPAFLWHTAADQSVPVNNSLLYAQALAKHGISFGLHVYPAGHHGLATVDEQTNGELDPVVQSAKDWLPALKNWLKFML